MQMSTFSDRTEAELQNTPVASAGVNMVKGVWHEVGPKNGRNVECWSQQYINLVVWDWWEIGGGI